jgi:hypothetical protein
VNYPFTDQVNCIFAQDTIFLIRIINMDVSKISPQILGPILDGDEVIIAVRTSAGRIRIVDLFCDVGRNIDYFILDNPNLFGETLTPRFNVNFFSPDNEGSKNPYVFFTIANSNEIPGSCVATKPSSQVPFPGIGLTQYPGFIRCTGSGNNVTCNTISPNSDGTGTYFASVGTPAPFQLVSTEGVTPWFPELIPPFSNNLVLALSGVRYRMRSIVDGKIIDNIQFPIDIGTETIDCITIEGGGCASQEIILIPTRFYESQVGSNLCSNCELNRNAAKNALCALSCSGRFDATENVCCPNDSERSRGFERDSLGIITSSTCPSDNLDCRNLCIFGFTQASDCNDGVFYDYCTSGKTCSGNCKSDCDGFAEVCRLTDTQTFKCMAISPTGTTGPTGTNNPFNLSSTEIIIIATISLILLSVVIYVVFAWSDNISK